MMIIMVEYSVLILHPTAYYVVRNSNILGQHHKMYIIILKGGKFIVYVRVLHYTSILSFETDFWIMWTLIKD